LEAYRAKFIERLQQRGTYSTWVLVAALAGTFANTFPITILTISLASIADEFGVRETTIAWVISAPLLLSAVTLPLLGKLGDLYGHRRIFLLGSVAATATAVATAFAWDAWSLIVLRTVAAVVGGATQPTAIALIFGVYPKDDRVRAMGWWSMIGAGAPAFGLVAGGPLVDLLGWRIVFLMQAVFSFAALTLAAAVLQETARQRVRFDVLGAVSLGFGVAGLMFALGRVRDVSLSSPSIWGAVVVGIVGLLAFVVVERRAAAPLLPLQFFRLRNFSAPIVSNAFNGGAYMGAFVIAPLVFLQIFQLSITQTAAIMLTRTATLTLSSPVGGRLGTRIGERGATLVGAGIMTVSLVVLAYAVVWKSLVVMAGGLVLQGMGHGLSVPSLASSVASAVPGENMGIAAATSRLANQVGVAFGITALTMVYGGNNTGDAFFLSFIAGAVLAALSFFSAGFMEYGTGMRRTVPVGVRT
jgi:MFS family permease